MLWIEGIIGQGAMPTNYQQVSSYYGSYAFNIRFPWDKAKKNKTLETTKPFKDKTNKKVSHPLILLVLLMVAGRLKTVCIGL